ALLALAASLCVTAWTWPDPALLYVEGAGRMRVPHLREAQGLFPATGFAIVYARDTGRLVADSGAGGGDVAVAEPPIDRRGRIAHGSLAETGPAAYRVVATLKAAASPAGGAAPAPARIAVAVDGREAASRAVAALADGRYHDEALDFTTRCDAMVEPR